MFLAGFSLRLLRVALLRQLLEEAVLGLFLIFSTEYPIVFFFSSFSCLHQLLLPELLLLQHILNALLLLLPPLLLVIFFIGVFQLAETNLLVLGFARLATIFIFLVILKQSILLHDFPLARQVQVIFTCTIFFELPRLGLTALDLCLNVADCLRLILGFLFSFRLVVRYLDFADGLRLAGLLARILVVELGTQLLKQPGLRLILLLIVRVIALILLLRLVLLILDCLQLTEFFLSLLVLLVLIVADVRDPGEGLLVFRRLGAGLGGFVIWLGLAEDAFSLLLFFWLRFG